MVGVHTAAVAEAMSFCARLGIDVDLMYNIVSNAAGSSNIFINSFSEMKEAGWKLQGERMRAVRDQLVSY